MTLSELSERMLLYPMKEAESDSECAEGYRLIFGFKGIRTDSAYKDYKNLYIRFRIRSEKIKEELFCDVKRKNWFLESGFSRTQVIDIKVNKKRNMNSDDIQCMRRRECPFVEFQKIHFLVMEPANNDVEIWGNDFSECRKLEPEWKKYLKCDIKAEDILAYHWKAGKKAESVREYSQMVKVTSATTSWQVIAVYIFGVIVIGLATNGLYDWIKNLLAAVTKLLLT